MQNNYGSTLRRFPIDFKTGRPAVHRRKQIAGVGLRMFGWSTSEGVLLGPGAVGWMLGFKLLQAPQVVRI